jgi:hypothetical protein
MDATGGRLPAMMSTDFVLVAPSESVTSTRTVCWPGVSKEVVVVETGPVSLS